MNKSTKRDMTRISVDPSVDPKGWMYAYEIDSRLAQAFRDEAKKIPPSLSVRAIIDFTIKDWDEGRISTEQCAIYVARSILYNSDSRPYDGPHINVIRGLINSCSLELRKKRI